MIRRYRRLVFSREESPQDEVIVHLVVLIGTVQFVLRRLASSTDYSLFWPHVPFGGVLDLILAFCVASVVGLLLAMLAVRLYRVGRDVAARIAR